MNGIRKKTVKRDRTVMDTIHKRNKNKMLSYRRETALQRAL